MQNVLALWSNSGQGSEGRMSSDTATREAQMVWIAITRSGEMCAFGVESAARAWAGERGSVREMPLRNLQRGRDLRDVQQHLAIVHRDFDERGEIIRQTERKLPAATQRAERLEAALRGADQALNDWINTYADDMCDQKDVAEARARIMEYGTVGYIAKHVAEIRAALRRNEKP